MIMMRAIVVALAAMASVLATAFAAASTTAAAAASTAMVASSYVVSFLLFKFYLYFLRFSLSIFLSSRVSSFFSLSKSATAWPFLVAAVVW